MRDLLGGRARVCGRDLVEGVNDLPVERIFRWEVLAVEGEVVERALEIAAQFVSRVMRSDNREHLPTSGWNAPEDL